MKKRMYFYILVIFVTLISTAVAQEQEGSMKADTNPRAEHLAIGFKLSDFQSDFGLGINLTSPYFAGGFMAIRANAGISWLNGIPKNKTNYDWMLYSPIRLGVVILPGMIGEHSRSYSEAGAILLIPSKNLSDSIAVGGYGLFGFEFFTGKNSPVAYYLEAGGVGSSGKADKIAGEPSYANGFFIEAGIRWYPY